VVSLTTAGVPWELVKEMDRIERAAWLIVIGENDGGRFDFKSWSWIKTS
jgi:hypothetical protein